MTISSDDYSNVIEESVRKCQNNSEKMGYSHRHLVALESRRSALDENSEKRSDKCQPIRQRVAPGRLFSYQGQWIIDLCVE